MLEKIRELICEFVDVDPASITENSLIRSDISMNSLDVINLAVALEDEFGISVPDNVAASFNTVGDIIVYIENNK